MASPTPAQAHSEATPPALGRDMGQARPQWFRRFLDSFAEQRPSFGRARLENVPRLIELYNSSWVDPKQLERFPEEEGAKATRLRIAIGQLASQIKHFPEGQLVGVVRHNGEKKPAVMLNSLVRPIRSVADIPAGYGVVTANRTFSNHLPLERIPLGWRGVLFCVSIATLPEFWGSGYATETLNHAIAFGEQRGLLVVPYSAPRGFGLYRLAHPDAKIEDYLLTTRPPRSTDGYRDYCRHLEALNRTRRRLFHATYGKPLRPLAAAEWAHEREKEKGKKQEDREAFFSFFETHGRRFEEEYGKELSFVDFFRLAGKRHVDPVIDLHLRNGADFIYDSKGGIACVFPDSRPEDIFAAGYNLCFTYSPSPLFNPRAQGSLSR